MQISRNNYNQKFKGLTLKDGLEKNLSAKTLNQFKTLQDWFAKKETANVVMDIKKVNPLNQYLKKLFNIANNNCYIKFSSKNSSCTILRESDIDKSGKLSVTIPAICKTKIEFMLNKNAYIQFLNKKHKD